MRAGSSVTVRPYALCLMPYVVCLMPYALCPRLVGDSAADGGPEQDEEAHAGSLS
jgi:hypothetical protein